MIIDSHVHFEQDRLDEIVAFARVSEIDKLCISTLGTHSYIPAPTREEIIVCNNATLMAMESYPDVFVGFCYLNPNDGCEALREMDRCLERGMKGVKLWIASKASSREVAQIAEHAMEHGVPLLQHSSNKTTGNSEFGSNSSDVVILAERFPKLTIIMAHLGGNGYRGVADVEKHTNIFIDTSGGEPTVGITEHAVNTLGAERILFGSDVPGRSFDVQIGKIFGAGIKDSEKDLILCGNMKRILKL
jgi:uncharacterized protein